MTPHRLLTAALAGVAAVALAVAAPAVASASSHSSASAAKVSTRYLSANGGTVTWTVKVHSAKPAWCKWSSSPKVAGFNAIVKCKTGKITRSARFKANRLRRPTTHAITLTVLAKVRTVDRWKVIEAGKGTPTNTCITSSFTGQCNYPADSYIVGAGSDPWVGQNVWTDPTDYGQTLHATSPADWHVTADADTHFGGVLTFPNTGFQMTGAVNRFTDITSSWNVTIPTNDTKTAAWAAYDLWFNNWNNEVMIQPDITANSYYQCTGVASLKVSGIPWHLCVFGSEDVWKPGTDDLHLIDRASGSVDIQAFLVWMEQHGYLPADSIWKAASFGFEICDTEGNTQTFAVNGFTWDATR